MKRELKKITNNVSYEVDKYFTNKAEENVEDMFYDNDLRFDKLSEYEKLELINKEKKRLKKVAKEKATQVSLVSVATFLLFGF